MFKIAYGAGHYLYEAGKRIPEELDPDQTREWTLNDRVARFFAEAAGQYDDVQLLRVDDPAGQRWITLAARCQAANNFGADLCLAIHHNAGINLGDGGGIEAYSCPGSVEGARYRDAIYDACIAARGLKGNRSQPQKEYGYYVLRYTHAPAVLMEYGFMDSATDAPVILTEDYARLVAYATMEGIARAAGLEKKQTQTPQAYSQEQFIRDVQRVTGSAVDGIAGPETIGNTVTVSEMKNSTHPAVVYIQKRLAALGYTDVGEADGIAGPMFTAAVVDFQKDNGCWRDGELTAKNKTWRKLLGME